MTQPSTFSRRPSAPSALGGYASLWIDSLCIIQETRRSPPHGGKRFFLFIYAKCLENGQARHSCNCFGREMCNLMLGACMQSWQPARCREADEYLLGGAMEITTSCTSFSAVWTLHTAFGHAVIPYQSPSWPWAASNGPVWDRQKRRRTESAFAPEEIQTDSGGVLGKSQRNEEQHWTRPWQIHEALRPSNAQL